MTTSLHIDYTFINVAPYSSPGHLSDFIKKAQDCCTWLQEEIKLDLKGRIPKYVKTIKDYEKARGDFGERLYYSLQSLNEMNDIIQISEQLRTQSSIRFKQSVKDAIHGPEFRGTTETAIKEKFRNYLFELKVASTYEKNNYSVDLSKITDIIVENPLLSIECKRVTSENQIIRRAEEAINQIRAHEDGTPKTGAIYVDITSIFEQAATIHVLNETGFSYSLIPSSSDEGIIELIGSQISDLMEEKIHRIKGNLLNLISDDIPCIVLNYDYIGFNVDIIHERAVTGKFSYLLTNEKYNMTDIMKCIKTTLGDEFLHEET